MKLTTYFRSSAAWRVRAALAIKGLSYESSFVHLTREGGEQKRPAYRAVNPAGLVPYLEEGDAAFGQSLAMIEYLEETRPEPPLLPSDPAPRAKVRELALTIACEMHPLNNLRVLQHLTGSMGLSEDQKLSWYRHWVAEGFAAVEGLLPADAPARGVCFGETVTLADLCLVPQVFNARRFDCDLTPYPKTLALADALMARPIFAETAPARQPDAE
ncbi:MAG: maleylacetoacetate isomerase [Marivibrio sp.]|uniref:maleylacetoacetate isomerase n=1 Tax=Marivibrio sp. TaxID=2039719 RepID=UPI0032EAB56D